MSVPRTHQVSHLHRLKSLRVPFCIFLHTLTTLQRITNLSNGSGLVIPSNKLDAFRVTKLETSEE